MSDEQKSEEARRAWVPNRQQKPKKTKKEFDRGKVESLIDDNKPVYKGELDPRKKDPDKKPRSISRSEEKLRAKAEKLAESDPSLTQEKTTRITDFREQYESCQASPGRLGALYATQQVRRRCAFAQEVIEATIDRSSLSKQDRAFATLLTLGVVSTWGSLDEVINRCLASPRDIQPNVRDAMRISTYEIIYMRKAPHAAVDQGVELVKAVAPAAAGLANAVLHRILTASETFPFDDPAKSIEALSLLYAFPQWLAKLLIQDMGTEAAINLMRASNDPAPLFVHVNALKATDEEVVSLLRDVGAEVEPEIVDDVRLEGCYRVSNSRVLADGRIKRLFNQGKILVSDAAAQSVVECVLDGKEPVTMLEIGAGRGTKTIMFQSAAQRKFGHQIALTSMDSHSFKTELLRNRISDYGVELSEIVTGNATRLDSVLPGKSYELVFIDAPCSGLGTLRRHQEIRWRLTPEHIEDLAQTGFEMLESASSHVVDGGSIVYSTCTVTYDETFGVVKRFLESDAGSVYSLAPIRGKACFSPQLASGTCDAHFAVRFVKRSDQVEAEG